MTKDRCERDYLIAVMVVEGGHGACWPGYSKIGPAWEDSEVARWALLLKCS